MSQPVLVKVYGNLFPATAGMEEQFRHLCRNAFPLEAGESSVSLKDKLLLISFEGTYFPQDELQDCLASVLAPDLSGKIDYLDMENWQMTRYLVTNGQLTTHTVSLNHVMDYSGF